MKPMLTNNLIKVSVSRFFSVPLEDGWLLPMSIQTFVHQSLATISIWEIFLNVYVYICVLQNIEIIFKIFHTHTAICRIFNASKNTSVCLDRVGRFIGVKMFFKHTLFISSQWLWSNVMSMLHKCWTQVEGLRHWCMMVCQIGCWRLPRGYKNHSLLWSEKMSIYVCLAT